jgi:hypothetical protein
MTRRSAIRVALLFGMLLGIGLGAAACSAISTLIDGWKFANAVAAELETETGTKPFVGFDWSNGRLRSVTVTYPQLYDQKPLPALAQIVRRAVENHFKQRPEKIVLSFAFDPSGPDTTAQNEAGGGRTASND